VVTTDLQRHRLIRLLRAAHAGERAAALAYRGHARSVRVPEQRRRIRRIEAEVWAHRAQLARMLHERGAGPAWLRELVFHAIGRLLGALCHVSGWFLPMYGAGWIEAVNVAEYQAAALLAQACGEHGYAAELLVMAQCEREHEAYFRAQVTTRWQSRLLGLWRAPAAGSAPGAGAGPTPTVPADAYLPVVESGAVGP
jgi:demethoxyubiquinone hydroxylase (CLK1/Coq7/Cat5 family)